MVHAFELGGEPFQCFRQHRSAADGEPFRNHDAFRRRIKSLERRMQQEGAAFIFGETAVFRNQDEIRLQADDGFERSKSAGFDAEIAGRVGEAGSWPVANWSGCRGRKPIRAAIPPARARVCATPPRCACAIAASSRAISAVARSGCWVTSPIRRMLFLDIIQRSRGIEFDDAQALVLE